MKTKSQTLVALRLAEPAEDEREGPTSRRAVWSVRVGAHSGATCCGPAGVERGNLAQLVSLRFGRGRKGQLALPKLLPLSGKLLAKLIQRRFVFSLQAAVARRVPLTVSGARMPSTSFAALILQSWNTSTSAMQTDGPVHGEQLKYGVVPCSPFM